MEGWRFFYQCVGLVSIACGAVVAAFAVDPRFVLHGSKTTEPPKSDVKGNLWPETLMIFRLRSFQVIIAQGIVGSM